MPKAGHDAAGGGASSSGGRPRVLIIDDEPLIGTTLRVVLEDEYDVKHVQSGDEARRILERDAGYDAILCDLLMPGLPGIELYEWLAREAPDAAERIVFMTGGVFTDKAEQFFQRVANRRLDKPFDPDELLRLLATMIAQQRSDG